MLYVKCRKEIHVIYRQTDYGTIESAYFFEHSLWYFLVKDPSRLDSFSFKVISYLPLGHFHLISSFPKQFCICFLQKPLGFNVICHQSKTYSVKFLVSIFQVNIDYAII